MKHTYLRAWFLKAEFLILLFTASRLIYAQDALLCMPIKVDGFTHEWPDIHDVPAYNATVATLIDPSGDGTDIDITALQVTNDENYIYFRIVLNKPYPLGENNSLFLELDTDNNPSTGYRVNGIGAELGWQFGQRFGYYKDSEIADLTPHKDVGFSFVPPFTAREYEVAISLKAEPRPGKQLFRSDTIRVMLWDNKDGGDTAPDAGKVFVYIIDRKCRNAVPLPEIKPKAEDGFRVLSWNVYNDGITDSTRRHDFYKILRIINPDVINFIECWKSTAAQVDSMLNSILPGTWYVKKYGEGVIFASRFKIEEVIPVNPGANENIAGFRLKNGRQEFIFFSCHLSCCYFDTERILETQALMAVINKVATYHDGKLRMPVILAGDFNIVGSDIPYRNLTSGQLHISQKPVLQDLVPIQTDRPFAITWRDYQKLFSPARLDYIFYTPFNLSPRHAFVLNTSLLGKQTLSAFEIDADIMYRCSDHLPLVADFKFINVKEK